MEEKWLLHFNPYHDKLGRFTSKNGGAAHRLSRKVGRSRAIDAALDRNIKVGKDKSPISPVEKMTKDASTGVENAKQGIRAVRRLRDRNRKAPKTDLSHMTDQELRQRVNRMNLERQYSSLTTEDTSRGFDNAEDILDVFGNIVGIAGGTLGIIATIAMLKNIS